jgi:hypothetical protein
MGSRAPRARALDQLFTGIDAQVAEGDALLGQKGGEAPVAAPQVEDVERLGQGLVPRDLQQAPPTGPRGVAGGAEFLRRLRIEAAVDRVERARGRRVQIVSTGAGSACDTVPKG